MRMIDKMHRLGVAARFADWVLDPVMRVGMGTLAESPQQTHRWNNRRLRSEEVASLDIKMMVSCDGTRQARPMGLCLFHLPLLGGWREYVVLEPTLGRHSYLRWYVGWINNNVAGVSRLPVVGRVRVLRGPEATNFFGVFSDGTQLGISQVGAGSVGETGSPHRKISLR